MVVFKPPMLGVIMVPMYKCWDAKGVPDGKTWKKRLNLLPHNNALGYRGKQA